MTRSGKTLRGRGFAHHLGVDPVALLSQGAQYVIDGGKCILTYEDAKKIVKMAPRLRAILSERIELDTGDTMTTCIEDISKDIPKATQAKYSGEAREVADKAAAEIDRIYYQPFEFLVDKYCLPHGAMKSEERMEAIACWDEAKKAWKRLRDLSRKYSNVTSRVKTK